MTKLFALFSLLLLGNIACSQTEEYNYVSIEEARTMNPEDVTAIRINKRKLTQFPNDILTYPNLRALDLSKNRITEVPLDLNKLKKLETIIMSKNRLESFPVVLCSMPYLKFLSISDNPKIENMPPCIEYAVGLEHLDIFNTGINYYPDELMKLINLKTLDARGILYGPIFQERWKRLLPNTDIKFDRPCNCIE